MIKSVLTSSADGRAVCTHDGYDGEPVLMVESYKALNGSFKAATRTSAGTTIIVQPKGTDAVVLTDLIMTTDKVNAATVTVRWTDGSNTIDMIVGHVTDAPRNVTIPFSGHWQGWQGARLEVVTVGAVKTTVSCGYFRIPGNRALTFSEWDAKR